MIEVTHLHKSFRLPPAEGGRWKRLRAFVKGEGVSKPAVRDISFTIGQGEFVGYIGPNGAGKSTTIKMLTGILHPTSGDVRIDGMNPHRERRRVVGRLGVVFGQRSQLWWDLPVTDSYDILAAMYRIPPDRFRRRLAELEGLLGLGGFLATPARKLSLGERMRADLAAALLHDPDILFLDEPTIGLDVIAKRSIRSLLATVNRELGKTVLLTTHDMDDIEQLCSRVMVINRGALAYDGTIQQLRERIGLPTRLRVTFAAAPDWPAEGIAAIGLELVSGAGEEWTVQYNRSALQAMEVLRRLEVYGAIVDIRMEEPEFEDIIRQIY